MRCKIKNADNDLDKYKLLEEEVFELPRVFFRVTYKSRYVSIENCILKIKKGFTFNGSTFVGDTPKTLYPSLIHDAIYYVLEHIKNPTIRELVALKLAADKIYLGLLLVNNYGMIYSGFRYSGLLIATPYNLYKFLKFKGK